MSTSFECESCGSEVDYEPGTARLECPYCGSTTEIAPANEITAELDLQSHTGAAGSLRVDRGAAERALPGMWCRDLLRGQPNLGQRPFCGTNVVLTGRSKRLIKAAAVLHFAITRQTARERLRSWIKGRWFAPNALKRVATHDRLQGVYLPA
jgi:hypothetical protein